ncbi:MAG: hypothetical protein LBG15_07230 [Dysgonamonadaceae bacterium]|jgi:hypothetical protein|nr:hypothetical protein [Dysgonamonadaceae bacterium]
MYIDKDRNEHFSIMEMKKEEISELGVILREFESLIQESQTTNDRTKARMVLASTKLRFQIIDAVK